MNQTIGVNITPQSFQPTLHYSQGDVGRVFVVNVTDYDIPSGATVTCVATKPSGMGFTVSGTVSGNSVTFTSTAEMTDEWGRFPAEIRIASGNTLLGTANFLMIGEKDPHPASTIDGTQEELIPQLTLLVNRVEAAAESVHDLTVSATTLTAGSDATATYDSTNNSIAFGIPRGADGDVTRSEFNDLKSDLRAVASGLYRNDNVKYKYVLGYYITLNVGVGNTVNVASLSSNSNYANVVIPCKRGDVFTLTGKGGSASRLWGFTDSSYKLLSVSSANTSGTNVNLTAPSDGYFISNVEYENVMGYALSVWHEVVTKEYIEDYNLLTVTPGVVATVSGISVEYSAENQFKIYGTASDTALIARFNGQINYSNSRSSVPTPTILAGTYTLYWDEPTIAFYYTEGAYNVGSQIYNGVPFTASNDFAIYIEANLANGSYGTALAPTVCTFTLFDGIIDADVLSHTTSSIDYLARTMAKTRADRGYYNLNRLLVDNGYINTNVSIGDVVDYSVTANGSFGFAIIPVSKGDVFKIDGGGGLNPRLWAFVDSSDQLIIKSIANLSAENLIVVAPDSGKFIYNASIVSSATYKPNIQKKLNTTTELYDNAVAQAKYDHIHNGFDILSAFSNVSCFGDSLTASVVYTHDNGDGTHQTRSAYKKYPEILGTKIGAEWESVATGGYSATDWWGAYSSRIISKTNQLCIIYLGTNGGLTDTLDTDAVGDDYTQYANTNTGNYCKMVAKSLSVGARVLLIKIHQGGGGDIFLTNSVIDKIATKFNVAVVDVPFLEGRIYHAFPDNTGTNTLHYNDLGYSAFADSLIRSVGYLPESIAVRLIPE